MNWHNRYQTMKSELGLTNSDIAEITGNTPDSIKTVTQPNKELPRWLKLAIVIFERMRDVTRSVYAVYPDAERLDIGKNRLSAIFRYKDHAEEFAKSKWGRYYVIEEMSSDHFA